MKKNSKNNVLEYEVDNCQHQVLEQSSNDDNVIPEVKKFLKILTPPSCMPSQYSRIHTLTMTIPEIMKKRLKYND